MFQDMTYDEICRLSTQEFLAKLEEDTESVYHEFVAILKIMVAGQNIVSQTITELKNHHKEEYPVLVKKLEDTQSIMGSDGLRELSQILRSSASPVMVTAISGAFTKIYGDIGMLVSILTDNSYM